MSKTNLFLLTDEELMDYYEVLLFEFEDTYTAQDKVAEARDEIIARMAHRD